MALTMTFWPNPVYRNHTNEMRWYFHVSVRQEGAKRVRIWCYQGEWYDLEKRLQDVKEEPLDVELGPYRHVSYPDLWVTSAIHPFRYRIVLFGREEDGQEVQTAAVLTCK